MSTPTLKAIETVYRGYRFRSRLEARWAVFLDTLDVAFEYEKEGFDLGESGLYLPDFWLPKIECWIEIKGRPASQDEWLKAACLAEQSGYRVFLFDRPEFEQPRFDLATSDFRGLLGRVFHPERYDDEGDFGCQWQKCSDCGVTGVDLNLYGPAHKAWCVAHRGVEVDVNGHIQLGWAYDAARSARFEHGESGPRRSPIQTFQVP